MANIFMAEDDSLMIRVYEKAFRSFGFELEIALDGEEAINKLKTMNPKPAIAILDVMMPKKSGFEVLEFMKKDNELKDIPVMILTNLFGEKDEKRGFELGAMSYVVKSEISPIELATKVKEIYEQYSKK